MTKATYKGKCLFEDLLTVSEGESVAFMAKDVAAGKGGTGLEQQLKANSAPRAQAREKRQKAPGNGMGF